MPHNLARIICTDMKTSTNRSIVAIVDYLHIGESVVTYWENGAFVHDGRAHHTDLINIPIKYTVTRWFNMYPDGLSMYRAKKEADEVAMTTRIACIEHTFEFEEGEGISDD